ncbi:hypothetical protein BDZ91DRAFT_710302 [Kalaharituber pfeilii]|nr:hypothetical protein BDZ91DRAFT_710302 [Kalaharituber pfeilii]
MGNDAMREPREWYTMIMHWICIVSRNNLFMTRKSSHQSPLQQRKLSQLYPSRTEHCCTCSLILAIQLPAPQPPLPHPFPHPLPHPLPQPALLQRCSERYTLALLFHFKMRFRVPAMATVPPPRESSNVITYRSVHHWGHRDMCMYNEEYTSRNSR